MAKEKKKQEGKLSLPEGDVKVIKDYFGSTLIGIQRGSDHQTLIRLSYPLKINYIKNELDHSLGPYFSLVDRFVCPEEIKVRASMSYKANDSLEYKYKNACEEFFDITCEEEEQK